jgi:Tol biopolymer transport system component
MQSHPFAAHNRADADKDKTAQRREMLKFQRPHLAAILTVAMVTLALAPAVSATYPDRNGRIAFYAGTGSGSQIFTVRPNGHDLRQVTHVNGDAGRPDWSPDGRRLVFEFGTEADCSNVAIMNADGSQLAVLPHGPDICEDDPTFTPEGSRIVFHRYDAATNVEALWSTNLDGTDRHLIIALPNGGADPNVSPDGQTLSFVGFNGQDLGQALFTVGMDGTGLTQLTPFDFDVGLKEDWAPDGRHLVFTDNADNPDRPANIAAIRPDGTGLSYVTHYESPDLRAYVGSYSPDGQWIIFRLEDHGSQALYRVRPDGSDLHAILRCSIGCRGSDWGPAPEH